MKKCVIETDGTVANTTVTMDGKVVGRITDLVLTAHAKDSHIGLSFKHANKELLMMPTRPEDKPLNEVVCEHHSLVDIHDRQRLIKQ